MIMEVERYYRKGRNDDQLCNLYKQVWTPGGRDSPLQAVGQIFQDLAVLTQK